MVATRPVDFRKGAEGLAALVREEMRSDPFSGTIYVFRARRADRVKLVFWDGTGVCLFAKRLEDGRFRWPAIEDGVIRLTAAQLSALLEVLDWRRVQGPRDDGAGGSELICGQVNQPRSCHRGELASMVYSGHVESGTWFSR
jgi:transposase